MVAVRGFLSFVLDTLSPALCVHCGVELTGRRTDDEVTAPSKDWPSCSLSFFRGGLGADVLCTRCWLRLQPSFAVDAFASVPSRNEPVRVISPFYTDDTLLSLVRFMKFSGGTSVASPLSWWMARALERAMAKRGGRILLVPVPLHWMRRWRRGYNQGALLARGVGGELDLNVDEGLIVRQRGTKRQANLKGEARRSNVRGAFRCRGCSTIRGADIVLIDDLVTSCETARWCLESVLIAEPGSLTILAAGSKKRPGSP